MRSEFNGSTGDKVKHGFQKVIAVMPACDAELILQKTTSEIPMGSVDEVILTDGGSKDRALEIAQK